MLQFRIDSDKMKNFLLTSAFLHLSFFTASSTTTWFTLDGTALGTLEDDNLNVYIPRAETERHAELDEYGWPEAEEELPAVELEPLPTTTPEPRPFAVARQGYFGQQPIGCELEACQQRCLSMHGPSYTSASCTLQRCFCYRVAPPEETAD